MRRRWIAAIAALAMLGVLVGALFGVKIGLASSGSLAKSGPAYEALQTLKQGGVSTGMLTPIEVLVDTDQAKTGRRRAGQGRRRRPRPRARRAAPATATAAAVLVVLPTDETVNSQSVGVVAPRHSATAHNDAGVPG